MKQLFPPEIVKNSAETYFIQQHTSGKAVYLVLLILLIVVLLLLPVVKVDITSQSNGVIRSRFEDNIVQSAVYGDVVLAEISENSTVEQGDTLIVVGTRKTDEQINYFRLQLKEDSTQIRDLVSLLEDSRPHLISDLFRQEYAGFVGKVEEQKVKMTQTEKEYILAKRLFEKKVIPQMEYEAKKNNHDFELNHFTNLCEQQKLAWQTRLTELRLKTVELKSNVEQLQREKQQYFITAPISGTVTDYSGITEGNFIVPNQQIARISPDVDLLVECYVTPANIGLIRPEMKVSYQFHTFNYNQWGTGSGKVTQISGNVISINDQPYFKVRCTLEQNHLTLKNGYKGYLKKGMTLTGRFLVIKRSLFQLLYDKTDNWLNPKITADEY